MASQQEFVQYIAEQLMDAGYIKYRKMFGEYGLYCNGKIFALVCDDQLFVKLRMQDGSSVPNWWRRHHMREQKTTF